MMSKELIDQLLGGILQIDEAGTITLINAPAERELGYAPGELVGQPFTQLLTVAGRLFCQTHFYPLVNLHGRVDELAFTFVTRTGERIPVLLNALRQHQQDGWHLYCVYLPLVQRHQLEAELIQARQAAEEAQAAVQEREAQYRALATHLEEQVRLRTEQLATMNKELTASNEGLLTSNQQTIAVNEELAQSNYYLTLSNDNLEKFAYIASHDLQEPLRKIQQFGDLLKTGYAGQLGEGLLYLERMQSAADRMSTLIKDLLNYSRISTQRDASAPVALNPIVDQVLTTLELTIRETGAQIQVDHLPTLSGDASQLGQLFQNLLGNALKFRRDNTTPVIEVRAKLVKAADIPASVKPSRAAAQYYRIEVADNGVGFQEKYLDRIFQVFQRLHGKNEFAGTGIGLAICEKVVSNHGGAITAVSQPGQGATFIVYLPSKVA